jgi:hypothetical protein
MGKVVHGEQHGTALFLDRVEGLVIVDVNLGVKEIVGDGGYGRGCIGGSSGYLRHVWGVGMKAVFLKMKRIRSVFISKR